MRLLSALLLASSVLLPAAAGATSIDDFVLKGEAQVITFSLPSNVVGRGSYGAGGSDGGFFADPSNLMVDGVTYAVAGMQVFSQFFPTAGLAGGFAFATPVRSYIIVGTVLYTGSSNDATFRIGSFNLYDFNPPPGTPSRSPYTLTITPEVSSVPEPSSGMLLATGLCALAIFASRGAGRNVAGRNRVRSVM